MPRICLKAFSRAAACSAVLAACGMAISAPPTDHPGAGQGRSAVDRALESRARIADRAADAARHTTTNPGAAAGTADAIDRAQSDAATRTSPTPKGNGLGVGGNAGGHASGATNGVGVGLGGDAKGHAAPQAGTGRLSRDVRGMSGRTAERGRPTTDATDASGQTKTRSGLQLGWLKRNEHAPVRQVSGEAAGSARVAGSDRREVAPRGFDLTRADRLLAHRLAQIERMRDRAVETDDENLLRQADRLEVIARAQYSQRTDGETSVGEAVKTFNASLRDGRDSTDDGTTTDPVTDGGTTDPVTDGGTTTDPVTDGGTTTDPVNDGGSTPIDSDSTPIDDSDSTPVSPSTGTP